jgi:hypothetical protein
VCHLVRQVRPLVEHAEQDPLQLQARVIGRAHAIDGGHQMAQPLEGVVLALHRDQHRVGRDQRVEREQAQARRAAESTAARQAIDSVNAQFGSYVGQGNVDGVVALYTSDAVLMPPNMPIASGREAIKAIFAGMMAAKPALTLKSANSERGKINAELHKDPV